MAYEIEFVDDALRDYRRLDAHVRASIRNALEVHLRHQPTKVSKSRIKRLRELRQPQFRLRVDDYRIYYDVEEGIVTILGVVAKSRSEAWLADHSICDND
jgi:mRNA-degrading endonuclease RelE of RelBE toxin-antitoxin system